MKAIPNRTVKELEELRENAKEVLSAMKEKFEELADAAQEYYDDRSEKWQESERGESYCEWVSVLEEKASDIDSIIDDLGYIDFDEIKAPA